MGFVFFDVLDVRGVLDVFVEALLVVEIDHQADVVVFDIDVAGGLSVPLAGQSNIRLIATAGAPDSTSNYAVWGRPLLLKPEK